MSSFFSIEILRRALHAQQHSMSVTGHNIANVNTPGFARQEAILATAPPSGGPSRQGTTIILGTGVTVQGVRQQRDIFLDQQVRQQRQILAEWQVRQELFSQVEAIFPEPSTGGLGTVLGRFWNAWQELSLAPESTAARAALIEQAQTLSGAFRQANQQIEDLRDQLDTVAVGRVGQVNGLAREISDLNAQISRFEVAGTRANDLRDRRVLLYEELTRLVETVGIETETGELLIYLQGRQLVGPSGQTDQIVITPGAPGSPHTFRHSDGGTVAVKRGDLAATLAARDTEVPRLLEQFNLLVGAIIAEVNAIHATGFSLAVPPDGGAFFVGTGAGDVAVRPDLAADPRRVAASASGEPGDGEVAMRIAQLRLARVLGGGTATIDETYRGLVSGIGVAGREAGRQIENQQLLLDQLRLRREAASGVSLDEEMTNMLRFQRAYEAAARVLRTVDSMIELILTELGR